MEKKKIEFVSYTGKPPALCRGILTLRIDGQEKTFGYNFLFPKGQRADYEPFWHSGGNIGFNNDMSHSVTQGNWEIQKLTELPEELRDYANELMELFNQNVPHGHCGGCMDY